MKLTSDRLKKLIMNELKVYKENEQQPTDQAGGQAGDAGEEGGADKEEQVKSTTALAKQLLDLSNMVKTNKIQGLDPNEIKLINGIIAIITSLASGSSAASVLQRIYDVLEKQAGK